MVKSKTIKRVQRILNILIIIAVCYLCWNTYDSTLAAKKKTEIENLVVKNKSYLEKSIVEEAQLVKAKDDTQILTEYSKLYEINSELIGWLQIEDTKVSYPVTVTNDNAYYLSHDFFHNKDRHGTIFADSDTNFSEKNYNIILYGHQMRDGSMFGFLLDYEDSTYYEEHPIIQFDSRTELCEYQVLAVFKSKIYNEDEDVFKYYQYVNIDKEDVFEEYYYNIMALAMYETGITAKYGDELLTLSTCDYSITDGRLVLVAKRIK